MLLELLTFYCRDWRHLLLPHAYRDEFITDTHHHLYRQYSKGYQKKQGLLKNIWIGAGLVIIVCPLLHVALIISLMTTFLSFMFLDEVE